MNGVANVMVVVVFAVPVRILKLTSVPFNIVQLASQVGLGPPKRIWPALSIVSVVLPLDEATTNSERVDEP